MAEQLELVRAPMPGLRPMFPYYGSKTRSAKLYPQPLHRKVVEPFAGGAAYALRYPDHDVTLVEAHPMIAAIWQFLIAATPHEVLGIPLARHVDEIPSWVPEEARCLIRFSWAIADAAPRNHVSAGIVKWQALERGHDLAGWSEARRARVAAQVPRIKHWRIIEGDYSRALEMLDDETTSFWDPPYSSPAGSKYPCRPKGTPEQKAAWYAELGGRIRGAPGQVIACENEGATWLPFQRFGTFRRGMNGAGSREVVYYQIDGEQCSTT